MKIEYYAVQSNEYDYITGELCNFNNNVASFSTKEKAERYLSKIQRKLKSRYLENHYRAIETANNSIQYIQQTGKDYTYYDWINEYNSKMDYLMFKYRLDIKYFITHVSINVDDEPEISI